jgi:UDP-N-acetylglucosamine acyltransferase
VLGFRNINGNLIHETAVIDWNVVKMGTGNKIFPFAAIGLEAQHIRAKSEGTIYIGNNNVIREYCSINMPTNQTHRTEIGSNNYIMMYVNVGHDTIIEDEVTISNASQISGHCHIMKGANIGLGCKIHQYQVIGSYAMLGMGTIVTKKLDILPGKVYVGSPARYLKNNEIGLTRNSIDEEKLAFEKFRYIEIRGRH